MAPPLDLDTKPMEARSVEVLPGGEKWRYEPKWDGFRCLAFRDGESVELRSKSGQPLGRYFPDKVPRQCGFDQSPLASEGALDLLEGEPR